MLISRKHKFIFLHIYKNAGTSITRALMPYASKYWQYLISHYLKKLLKQPIFPFDPQPFEYHAKASEVIGIMGQDEYNRYFSFAIVRNPWDWQVSLYKYATRLPSHFQHQMHRNFGSFDNYIRWRCAEEVRFQKDFVCNESGDLIVDYVGRYENLEKDFQTICARIGISASLPRLNVSNTIPYQEYYTEETKELVERTFKPDIEYFGYRY